MPKSREVVEGYIEVVRSLQPRTIVELGVDRGGSSILLAELAAPEKLVAIEFDPTPVASLRDYIDEGGFGDVVRPHHGVDQADRSRVHEIVRDELGGSEVDLVIDDASHLYEASVASFETLFPHLRPGGLYILEHWRWQHRIADELVAALESSDGERRPQTERRLAETAAKPTERETPLSQLAVQLLLARASSGAIVDEVTINAHWIVARRGSEVLDPPSFRVGDLFEDWFHQLGPFG